MGRWVTDSSVTLTWCFEDEATPATDALLSKLRAGDEAAVPAHWPVEIANSLLMAIRRGRISREKAARFFQDLRALPIQVEPESGQNAFDRVFAVASQYRLTAYDAAYLELAIREGSALATLDEELRRAAREAGVSLMDL
jgi:predicted nucleic acid-binding protein